MEETTPAEAEEAPPTETEVVEETPSAERGEGESGGGHQHAAQRDGDQTQVGRGITVAHQAAGQAAGIGSSMDGVLEELDSSVEGKIERVVGEGPSAGPAPPPSDHVSTSMGGPSDTEGSRSGRGRAEKTRGGVRTRGGLSPGPAPGAGGGMRRRETDQEPQLMPPGTSEEVGEDMDLSPEGINRLKRKAKEEKRINAKK